MDIGNEVGALIIWPAPPMPIEIFVREDYHRLGGRNILRPYFAGYILIADNKLRQSVCGDEFVEESAVVLGE